MPDEFGIDAALEDLRLLLEKQESEEGGICPLCFLNGISSLANYLQINDGGKTYSPQVLFAASMKLAKEYDHEES
jgi:hypothetical protein